jgi:uroporphyrinogen decarboxylase
MNSRERVMAALNHREPDRVPVDFSGHRSSGIAAIAYARLRKHLGLAEKPVRVYDPIQQLAIVDEDVLDLFEIDAIELGRGFALQDDCWADWVLPDGSPCQMPSWALPERDGNRWVYRAQDGTELAHMPDGVLYFEQTSWPDMHRPIDLDDLAGALENTMWTTSRIAAPPGPLISGPDGEKLAIEGARKLRQSTSRAIIGLFGGNLLETGQFLYRNDRFFMLLAGEPQKAHEFLDRLTELHLKNLETFLGRFGPYIDVIQFGDDLGMQTGPQISPRMYRQFFKPRHSRMWKRAKELANVKVMLHCCGGVRELLPDLIEAGLDAINPVQITCKGMEPQGLKADFGKEMTFWGGGCDTRFILPEGSPEEVRRHVRGQVKILEPGGGFVFQQVHNIMANVPPQNVVAMFEGIRT